MSSVPRRSAIIIVSAGLAAITILTALRARRRWRKYHAHDANIAEAARAYRVNPRLIRAVIRRESSFVPNCVGAAGEAGLMQITEGAALEWARAHRVAAVHRTELFEPGTNIRIGTWYLARAIRNWSEKPDPLPYALAEYNAGRANARRWAAAETAGEARTFLDAISYPQTRSYVEEILLRYRCRVSRDRQEPIAADH